MRLRIGTRASPLARAQAGTIARSLESLGFDTEILLIETAGDRDRTSPFSAVGAPGIFVREIQRALLESRIDVAVHSYKDLPSDAPAGLTIGAVPERADPRDRLVIRTAAFDPAAPGLSVSAGARVGTSAARRSALVREMRPDVQVLPLRGNVNTRLDKLARGDYEAIVLAAAGLDRMAAQGYVPPADLVEQNLDVVQFTPAPSQGALALEVRTDDGSTRRAVRRLDDAATSQCVSLERNLLALLQAGCDVAFGAWCEMSKQGQFALHGVLARDGHVQRAHATGSEATAVVQTTYEQLTAPFPRALA